MAGEAAKALGEAAQVFGEAAQESAASACQKAASRPAVSGASASSASMRGLTDARRGEKPSRGVAGDEVEPLLSLLPLQIVPGRR